MWVTASENNTEEWIQLLLLVRIPHLPRSFAYKVFLPIIASLPQDDERGPFIDLLPLVVSYSIYLSN